MPRALRLTPLAALSALFALFALPAGALLALASPAAAAVRVVSADSRGLTLEVTVGAWSLSAPGRDGRVRVTGLSESHEMAVAGRAMLPAWAATLAIPGDARPSARVTASTGEQSRASTRIVIAGRPVFREGPDSRLGYQPAVEAVDAIVDGVWPESQVELGAPFGFRGRRFVTIEVRPFRYDESAALVSSPLSVTVRVDWNRPAAAAALPASSVAARDRNVDAALETSVLNWEQASGWRVTPAAARASGSLFGRRGATPAKAAAFDEDQPEVRVRITETALHRLPFDDVAPMGYPNGVPVAEVSVHRHEFLEGAVPPYGTIELPSEVQDANGNGVFDSGDAVLVWVRTWAERSQATNIRRFWGDAEVVYVTRKLTGGLRVAHRPGWNNVPALTPLASYPFPRHYERDASTILQFVPNENDTNLALWHWTEASLYYNRPDTIRIPVNDLDNTKDGTITVRWMGRRSDLHFMWAALRNGSNVVTTVVDSVVWSGKTAVTRTSTFPGTALSNGNNNFFRQWGKSQFGAPDPVNNNVCFAGLDWFDLTYWRGYRAVQDYVRFNTGDGTGDVQMSVSGFLSDSIRVYDVTDPDQPVRVALDASHITVGPTVTFEIQDVVGGVRRDYVAVALQDPADPSFGPRTPPASEYSAVTRRNLWSAGTGDYLLVTPEAFASAATPLANLRRSQGLTVLESPVECVFDEFDGGRHSGTAIERFTKYAYEQWDSRFLMLLGDGTLDPMKVRVNSGRDWVPVLPTTGPIGPGTEGVEIIPSDNLFAFLTGNEDPVSNPDTNRVVPEMMVGRLTVNSLAEATTVVNKIVAYENIQQPDSWRRNVLLTTDDAYSGETTFGGQTTSGYCHRVYEELFVDLNRTMKGFIDSDSGLAGLNVEEFNLGTFLTGLDVDTTTNCRLSRDDARSYCHAAVTPLLLGKLNAGQFLWNYQGHANEFVLTHEDLYVNSGTGLGDDSQRLMNNDKPFLFTAFSCHANMFARPDHQNNLGVGPCIGEDLLALPSGRGAVASWASVCYEVVPRNGQDHINVELIRSLFVNPPRDEYLGADDRGARVVLGEAILASLFRYVGSVQNVASERGISITYTLLGDPATRMSIGRPLSYVLANQQPVTSGQPLRLHTPGPDLLIDASVVSNVRIDTLAFYINDGAGDVLQPSDQYTLTPAFPDTGAGNLYGGRRFRLTHLSQPAARSRTFSLVARDRNGLVQRTDVVLQLEGVLSNAGAEIGDNDEVSPNAALTMKLLSPAPIVDPLSEISLVIGGASQDFTATPAPGDASGREWVLSWTHADYPIDDYTLVASVQNGGNVTLRFRVTASAAKLAFRDLFPFPNPVDNDGTQFSFMLLGGEVADVKLHIFSQSGRSIYTQVWRALTPGYHQLAWDARDAEGDDLANGVYFFRMSATTPSGTTTQQLGRLVKLRKPNRVDEPVVP